METVLLFFELSTVPKNAKVATSLSSNNLLQQPVSGCVCMACDSLLTTSLLQLSCQQTIYKGLWRFWLCEVSLTLERDKLK